MRRILFLYLFLIITFLSAEELELSFVGDIMAHDVNFKTKDQKPVYDGIRDLLLEDDLTFGNLECPVNENRSYSTYPQFNVQREYVRAVIDAGVDVFSMANNHTYDQGVEGLFQTLISIIMLKEESGKKIYFSGIKGSTIEAFRPVTIYQGDFKIGFIALTGFSNLYPTNKEYLNVISMHNKEKTDAFLEFVKTEAPKYNLFIVSYHEGLEYKYKPHTIKEEYFKKIIAAGAHIVYGHHPHVLQPVEVVKVNGQSRLIIYSAGNFISGQRWYHHPIELENYRSYTGDSAIFQVTVDKGTAGISGLKMVLITNHIDENRQVVIKTFENILTEDLPEKWLEYYRGRYKIMQKFLPDEDILKE